MNFRISTPAPTVALILAGALLPLSGPLNAADPSGQPLVLRAIMQDMGQQMQRITDGISREDWALVADAAPRVGAHAQPPAQERGRILGVLGADAPRFKGYDEETHRAAQALAATAASGDGTATIAAFARLQGTCLACHQTFRQTLISALYQAR